MKNLPKSPQVAIIGAGVAGLTAIKSALEEGLTPIAFEQAEEIGGNWRYEESLPDGGGPAYRSLRTNTSRRLTEFSDFPFPSHLPEFLQREDVLQYLHAYAGQFGLLPYIRFQTQVQQATPTGDGKWQLTLHTPRGVETHLFDALIVASGFYRAPYFAPFPGAETFTGRVLHSKAYKGPEGFEGQRVIVIGNGSSGADIAAELSTVAARVELSARTGVWFVPHLVNGKAYDAQRSRFSDRIPNAVSTPLFHRYLLKIYKDIGFTDETLPLLRLPDFDPRRARFIPTQNILEKILHRQVHLKPDLARINPTRVTYVDHTQASADVLVYCTGYSLQFPFFDPALVPVEGQNVIRLYKQVFHPQFDNLAFLAMNFVAGSVFPLAEIQARWAARVFAGQVELPHPDSRAQVVDQFFAGRAQLGVDPMSLLLSEYVEDIAGILGVRPQVYKHPALFFKLLFGPLLAAHYRLDGPGSSAQGKSLR